MSRLFTSGGQSIGASASASVLPMNSDGLFPLGLTGLISLLSMGLSRVFFSTTIQKHQFFGAQHSLWINSHLYMTTGKTIALTIWHSGFSSCGALGLAALWHVESSQTRDQTRVPCICRQILNHLTTREVPSGNL